jgi:hypothetical protein
MICSRMSKCNNLSITQSLCSRIVEPQISRNARQAKKTDDAETVDVLLLSQRPIPLTVPCFTGTVRGKAAPGEAKRGSEASGCGQLISDLW